MTENYLTFFAAGFVIFFALYNFFDSISIFARAAGGRNGQNAMGFAFQNIVNTVKRVFLSVLPPLLGIQIVAGDLRLIKICIFMALFSSIFTIMLPIFFRHRLLTYFGKVYRYYSRYENLCFSLRAPLQALFSSKSKNSDVPASDRTKESIGLGLRKKKFFIFGGAVAYFFLGQTFIILNIISFFSPEYSVIVLQMNAFFTGIGAVILSMYLDPKITNQLDKSVNENLVIDIMLAMRILGIVLGILSFGFLSIYIL
ncbi:hypothetical protein N9X91_01270 [Alphaproteobacteria bacterium]|nr:hypothetical protein [Alphaproteobacteria bacterium]